MRSCWRLGWDTRGDPSIAWRTAPPPTDAWGLRGRAAGRRQSADGGWPRCSPAGREALLSHRSAAALWGIRRARRRCSAEVEWSCPAGRPAAVPAVRAHRRRDHDAPGRRDVDGIPVTHPVATWSTSPPALPYGQLEAAVNEADHLRAWSTPSVCCDALDALPRVGRGRRGCESCSMGPTVTLTSTELERRFLPLALRGGLACTANQTWLRRPPSRLLLARPGPRGRGRQPALPPHAPSSRRSDKRRDNAHAAFRPARTLRFTHGQICHEPEYVRATLAQGSRLGGGSLRT